MPQVRLNADTILLLKGLKLTKRESYDEIIKRLIINNKPKQFTSKKSGSYDDPKTWGEDRAPSRGAPESIGGCPTCGNNVWQQGADGKKCKNCGELVRSE